jgi:uncharacterized OB-fold protein
VSVQALVPVFDEEARPFFEGALRGELRVQQCPVSGRLLFPPRVLSPFAPDARPRWVTVSGRGTLWSFAVPHPPLLPPFADVAPYNVVVVALEEDPRVRLVGNVVAREGGSIAEVDPARLEIGAPLRVCFERLEGGLALPRWLLAGPLAEDEN